MKIIEISSVKLRCVPPDVCTCMTKWNIQIIIVKYHTVHVTCTYTNNNYWRIGTQNNSVPNSKYPNDYFIIPKMESRIALMSIFMCLMKRLGVMLSWVGSWQCLNRAPPILHTVSLGLSTETPTSLIDFVGVFLRFSTIIEGKWNKQVFPRTYNSN
jgi:hypothetical protein